MYIGLAVCYAPWSHMFWDQNPLFLRYPTLGDLCGPWSGAGHHIGSGTVESLDCVPRRGPPPGRVRHERQWTKDHGTGINRPRQQVADAAGDRDPARQRCPPPLDRAPLAYENSAFLNSADGRLIRIVAEYVEPLARFRKEQIQDTVVFFGSARFRGREEADHALELLDNTGSSRPAPSEEQPASIPEIVEGTATDLQRKRAVAAVEMARYYEDARRLAQLLTNWAKSIPSAAPPLRGHLGRRPGHHGSGQPRRP